ncbi:hypothetical protein BAUCODRAFT_332998 [Baudoinia panamericana UAMH 10762]|uniref:Uncharacterized protein n=1 Tax=Baudoinia panamericana (strain UAMH 10762) TaxID=717646 RepID=M2MIB6_BAUPA|nr:uncharacterized protein BAUCODRAFT_332998 [Baudoinia panamericana UAMH 10762]EMC90998.1 hypothetical protein BAUCODRAFT_332998 [Baudoinia panamericana UAMH 10762]
MRLLCLGSLCAYSWRDKHSGLQSTSGSKHDDVSLTMKRPIPRRLTTGRDLTTTYVEPHAHNTNVMATPIATSRRCPECTLQKPIQQWSILTNGKLGKRCNDCYQGWRVQNGYAASAPPPALSSPPTPPLPVLEQRQPTPGQGPRAVQRQPQNAIVLYDHHQQHLQPGPLVPHGQVRQQRTLYHRIWTTIQNRPKNAVAVAVIVIMLAIFATSTRWRTINPNRAEAGMLTLTVSAHTTTAALDTSGVVVTTWESTTVVPRYDL